MWGIFRFLKRYGNFFLYLMLLSISLVLLTQNRARAGYVLNRWTFNSMNLLAERINLIGNYYYLNSQNRALQQENKRLYEQLYNRPPVLGVPQGFHFIPAEVVNKNYRSGFDFIVLNKGASGRIAPDDGVVSSQGVVGTVRALSDRFAKVITIYNPKFSLLVGMPHSEVTGFIQPDYRIFPLVRVTDVPFEAKVRPGDTLVTIGNSLVFAPDIPVGRVDSIRIDTLNRTKELFLRPFTDFRRFRLAYVIHHDLRKALDSLNNEP